MTHVVIRNLTKRYGGAAAVSDLSLEMEKGEFVTLLGPSGCGKTTTLRMLAGFITPDAGEIIVDNRAVSSASKVIPPEQRRMGMVFQNYAVWPHMTVFDNVAFGLQLRKLPKQEIREKVRRMLDLVELSPLAERYPHQLSGGQQQRVALGRSLVSEPSILLLDEPLSNLDAKLREQLRFQLKHLQRRTGITFVYVTHDQAEALALSDRIAVLHEGALQQYGSPREVYERPANLFVADFMGLVNKVRGRLAGSSNDTAQVTIGNKHTLVASLRRGPEQEDRDVMVVIRPEAIQLSADSPALPTNVLHGTVAESTFLGNFVEYRIDLKELSLRVQSDRYTVFDVGSRVWLTVPVDECIVM